DLRIGQMELFANRLGERARNMAIVEVQNIDGEENHSGEEKTRRARFLRHVRMLARKRSKVESRKSKVESRKSGNSCKESREDGTARPFDAGGQRETKQLLATSLIARRPWPFVWSILPSGAAFLPAQRPQR